MSSTIGGEDINHDLSADEKDKLEKKLRADARELILKGKKKKKKSVLKEEKKKRNSLLNQANEISRRKSKRADHH